MIKDLIANDHEYIKEYSNVKEYETYLEFYDPALEGMYDHNFISIKDQLKPKALLKLIEQKIDERKKFNKDYLKVELNFDVPKKIFQKLSIQPEVSVLDYMIIDTKKYHKLNGRKDCNIQLADTDELMEDGLSVNYIAFAGVEESFVKQMNNRKAKVFLDKSSKLNLYICFYENKPVGNVEYFTFGNYAKVEDFDIIDDYQRMGFGTTVLKALMKKSYEEGIEFLYLVTDHGDTAKDMYKKCFFKKVGEFTELFFDLRSD